MTESTTNMDKNETRKIERVGFFSFLVNLGLAGLKTSLAYFSGSLALTADAVDSFTDSLASLAVWGGIKLSSRKSRAFPYGLYKIENVMSVVVAMLIFFAGIEIARKIFSPTTKPLTITPMIIGGVLVGLGIAFLFGRYAVHVGKRTGSPTLMAEGRHRQVDVLSSSIVFVAIMSNYFGLPFDSFAAALVLIFIGYAGWELLSDGMRVLLDASLDKNTLSKIQKIIESESAIAEVISLVGRNAGRYRFIETDVVMRTNDLKKVHTICKKIEANIKKEVPHVERVLIHCEPRTRRYLLIAVPLSDTIGTISIHFGEAPYFALLLLNLADGRIERQVIIANPYTKVSKAKGIRVAEWLVEKKVDIVVSQENLEGKGPAYVFAGADISYEKRLDKELITIIDTFLK